MCLPFLYPVPKLSSANSLNVFSKVKLELQVHPSDIQIIIDFTFLFWCYK